MNYCIKQEEQGRSKWSELVSHRRKQLRKRATLATHSFSRRGGYWDSGKEYDQIEDCTEGVPHVFEKIDNRVVLASSESCA